MEERKVTFDIKEHIATLNESSSGRFALEFNKVEFNDSGIIRYDIRKWNKENDQMLKGISLSEEEVKKLKEALIKLEI